MMSKKSSLFLLTTTFFSLCSTSVLADNYTSGTYDDYIVHTGYPQLGIAQDATADGTIVNSGGNFSVFDNGHVTNTTVNQGGNFYVANNGFSDGTTVNGGGYVEVQGSGNASNLTVSGSDITNTGRITVQAFGNVDNVTVNDNGNLYVSGVATDVNQNAGWINVQNGGTVNNLTLNNGETYLETGGIINNMVMFDGQASVANNSSLSGLTMTGGSITLHNASNLENASISQDAVADVFGNATNVTVDDGGTLNGKFGATIENLNAGNGALIDLENGVVLQGNNVFSNQAQMGGSFDYITFAQNITGNITLEGGINSALGISFGTTADDTSITLKNGDFDIGTGTVDIIGFDNMFLLSDNPETYPTTVLLSGDLDLNTDSNVTIGSGVTVETASQNLSMTGNLFNNGVLDISSTSADNDFTIEGNYTSNNALLKLNINPDASSADVLTIEGDVQGTTNVHLFATSNNMSKGEILFVDAQNDDTHTASDFNIWRVDGSSYAWDTINRGNKWYAYSTNVMSEVAAYAGLLENALMQNHSLIADLRKNIAPNHLNVRTCLQETPFSKALYCKPETARLSAFVSPVYSKANVEFPLSYEAEISGVDAGLDLVSDGTHKVGIMASVRDGSYEFSGNSDKYNFSGSAETSIDSYLAGIFYRMDKNHLSTVAAIYGEVLKADFSSNDGVTADTDGHIVGASLDVSYIFNEIKDISIEPSLRITYEMLNLDGFTDNAGKSVDYDKLHYVEVEFGTKFAKNMMFDNGALAQIYFKPSLIQTFNSVKDIQLSDGLVLDGTQNRTLGNLEIGANYQFNTDWSFGAFADYTFGDEYSEWSASLNLLYHF